MAAKRLPCHFPSKPMIPARVGIVGIGGYGRVLLENLLEEKHAGTAEIAAAVVVDPAADAAHLAFLKEQAPQARIYPDLQSLCAAGEELDLMMLPVGIPYHAELTLAALEAGWNVMVEKPLAGSVEAAMRIVEAAERSSNFVAVGYQDMYGQTAHEIKHAILSGAIGTPQSIKSFAIWGRPLGYYQRNSWAGKLSHHGTAVFDSPFNNALAHYVNMALFLAGANADDPAGSVSAEAALFRGHEIESCDTASIRWQTDSGVEVGAWFSHLSSLQLHPEMRILGSAGGIFWKMDDFWELRRDGHETLRHPAGLSSEFRKAALRRIIEKARGADVPVFTAAQAMAQVRATALAHAATKIQQLPAAAIHKHATEDAHGNSSHWVEVPALGKSLREAFENNRLLTLEDFKTLPAD